MKFHLISDNIDTIVGMRLAGITGVLVRGRGSEKGSYRRHGPGGCGSDPNDGKAGKAFVPTLSTT